MGEMRQIPAAGEPFRLAGPPRPEPRVLAAEWALWGKEARETGYHVLRCSRGALGEKDLTKAVTRYSPGELDGLPQYTVSWIPGANKEPEYLVLGVHEAAPSNPRRGDDRSRRDAVGREIVFVRLFCLRYADLAAQALRYQDQALGYQDLIRGVRDIQFPVGATEPARVTLPPTLTPVIGRGPGRGQAEEVAVMLLTGRQVCVLGAGDVPVAERLQFIDTVMAMLPYGLRATMSAATQASSTSQELKLRLFFASTPRAKGRLANGRAGTGDFLVEWGKQDEADTGDRVAELYRLWLKDAKSGAPALLARHVVPVRFAVPDLRRLLGNLPGDKSVQETLDDLASDLRARDLDVTAVSDAAKRLRRYLAGEDKPDDPVLQHECRDRICRLGLLAGADRLPDKLRDQLYDQLLRVAFGPALTYAGFCDIEQSVGAGLPASLRSALARFRASDWLAYLLAGGSQPGPGGARPPVDEMPAPVGEPLDDVMAASAAGALQPGHGAAVLDWALRELRQRGDQPGGLLAARGYLAPAYEYVYRGDLGAQVAELRRVLDLAFDGQLSRPEIDQVLGRPDFPPTVALGQAVASMTGRRNLGYVQARVSEAFLRRQGIPEWVLDPRQRHGRAGPLRRRLVRSGRGRAAAPPGAPGQPRPGPPVPAAGPRNHPLSGDGPWEHSRLLAFLLVVALAAFALAYLFLLRHT
jgi:hypothetical protein